MFGANPLIQSNANQVAKDYATDFDITHVLKRATKVPFDIKIILIIIDPNYFERLSLETIPKIMEQYGYFIIL